MPEQKGDRRTSFFIDRFNLYHSVRAAEKQLPDKQLILTGDSDFSPLARTFKSDFPSKEILFALPFARATKELKQICPNSFTISKEAYAKHQFPERVRLPSNRFVSIPEEWRPSRSTS